MAASFLSWAFDAFDFFLLVFVLRYIASEFRVPLESVTFAIFATLAARPIGAFVFGRGADRFGRRPILAIVIVLYSVLELASAFSPTLTFLIGVRALFGIAMGGVWGVATSLTMESIPPSSRGTISGVLQAGYPTGYLIAALAYGLLFEHVGWRGLFIIGALPALLAIYVVRGVRESPSWEAARGAPKLDVGSILRAHWRLALYAVALMTAFNFFSHATQDLYPTFLEKNRDFGPKTVMLIAVTYNVGAILGGLTFGTLSERIGRRRAIVCAALLSLPIVPLWVLAPGAALLAVGAFLMQFMVQGAWGVIPAHLNELSPAEARGTFPGVVYQLGNLIAAVNAPLQAAIAGRHHERYDVALAMFAVCVALAVAILTALGAEAKGVHLAARAEHRRGESVPEAQA